MATTEEERFENLVGISHFAEVDKAMAAFQAADMNTICKYITTAPELELVPLATDTLKMVATALADAISTDLAAMTALAKLMAVMRKRRASPKA